jgi:cobalt/nickel transport protein
MLIAGVLAMVIIPLLLVHRPAGEESLFSGADDQATEAIKALSPGYKPWFSPVFEPPSGEIETMLFALQAALGAGVIGYYFGLAKGRAGRKPSAPDKPCT